MSEGGHSGSSLGNAAQWAGIIAVLLSQLHQCRTEDKEATKTSVQVSSMAMRVEKLEANQMALERIEAQGKATNQRLDDFKQHVDQRFDDLKNSKKR